MKSPKFPKITLTTEAQPWPKGHVARIASLRMGAMGISTINGKTSFCFRMPSNGFVLTEED